MRFLKRRPVTLSAIITLCLSRPTFRVERCCQAQAVGGPRLPGIAAEGAGSRQARSHLVLLLGRGFQLGIRFGSANASHPIETAPGSDRRSHIPATRRGDRLGNGGVGGQANGRPACQRPGQAVDRRGPRDGADSVVQLPQR